jgi:hypothetical protein
MSNTDSGWRKRQIALEKKAENARELELDYEPDKTVIEMAREAGAVFPADGSYHQFERHEDLEAFAALIRADERNRTWTPSEWTEYERSIAALVREDEAEKHKWDIHSCGPTCKRYACVAMREAVLAEREACANVCEDSVEYAGGTLAAAIRERGNT